MEDGWFNKWFSKCSPRVESLRAQLLVLCCQHVAAGGNDPAGSLPPLINPVFKLFYNFIVLLKGHKYLDISLSEQQQHVATVSLPSCSKSLFPPHGYCITQSHTFNEIQQVLKCV